MPQKPPHEKLLEKTVKELKEEALKRRQAEGALRESEKRLAQIVQGSPIATFVIDSNHCITHCNKAFENLTGIGADQIIGTQNQWSAFYPAKRPVMADLVVDEVSERKIARYYGNAYRKSAVIEGAYEAEAFFSDAAQNGKWLYFTAAPLRDAKGHIIGAIETLQDVTERKQAEENLSRSERRYRTLLDFLPQPVVLFTPDGRVSYLNDAFSETFGWTFEELAGKRIPYVPPDLQRETSENIERLFREKVLPYKETKRLTKDGRILDVSMKAALYSDGKDGPRGELVMLRDITLEKRIARQNEASIRISKVLPEYPDLEDLLDYISGEVKRLLDTEGALVILRDEETDELFFLGVAYDDTATQRRVKEIRFPTDRLVAGKVIKTGKPILLNDTFDDPDLHQQRDRKLGYRTRNLLLVPLKSSDRIIGVLCAINKKTGDFDQSNVDLLNMIAGTVALTIENARFSEEIKKTYREVSSLNRAKDKVINHLSHELKTPLSILATNLKILTGKLEALTEDTWKPAMERARRNLDRVLEIQYKVHDMMQEREYRTYGLLSLMLDQCTDELETLLAEQAGEGPLIERVRKRVEEIYGPKELISTAIVVGDFVESRIKTLKPYFLRRRLEITHRFDPSPPVYIPHDPLKKVVDGLLKNAVENTPDGGKIEILIQREGDGTLLLVRDYGVGITEEAQRRVFEGFFTTRDLLDYSSKNAFDFNAGGKGADLLRMKIFSERYGFEIKMASTRCRYIPEETDVCPGNIHDCPFSTTRKDCYRSGGTLFSLHFPPPPKKEKDRSPSSG